MTLISLETGLWFDPLNKQVRVAAHIIYAADTFLS